MLRIRVKKDSFFARAMCIIFVISMIITAGIMSGGNVWVIIVSTLVVVGIILLKKYLKEYDEFDEWRQRVKAAGLENTIKNSTEAAIEVYKTNPRKSTKKYIRQLNPEAGKIIEQLSNYNE